VPKSTRPQCKDSYENKSVTDSPVKAIQISGKKLLGSTDRLTSIGAGSVIEFCCVVDDLNMRTVSEVEHEVFRTVLLFPVTLT
jgi:hypothetical protein